MSIRVHLKEQFQDRIIIGTEYSELIPEQAIVLQEFLKITEEIPTKKVRICNTDVNIVTELINPIERKTLSVSQFFPPKLYIAKPAETIPKNYIPIADWNGRDLRIAVVDIKETIAVRNIFLNGVRTLISSHNKNKSEAILLRRKISFGLEKEKGTLLANANKNRLYAEKQLKQIEKFLESANRQERIAANLERLEKEELDKFAHNQWEDLQQLIPAMLQDVYIEEDKIQAITNPIIVNSVVIGACRIEINISTAQVTVWPVDNINTRSGYCHPHVGLGMDPCWGNLTHEVIDMTANREYYGLVNATLRLLYQYRADDAYLSLDKWGSLIIREETNNCEGRIHGPGSSYSQMKICMSCRDKCTISIPEKIQACISLRTIEDCIDCNIKGSLEGHLCLQWQERFRECFKIQTKNANTYCMIKCQIKDCTFFKTAQENCQKEYLDLIKGECPAKEVCREPCY